MGMSSNLQLITPSLSAEKAIARHVIDSSVRLEF
jgi:hypothetical protein